LVAQGVLNDSEQHIPPELLAWRSALGRLEVEPHAPPTPEGQQSL
jgi:hypothetical protein